MYARRFSSFEQCRESVCNLAANLLLHILDGFLHFIQLLEQLLLLLLLPVVLPQKMFVYSNVLVMWFYIDLCR